MAKLINRREIAQEISNAIDPVLGVNIVDLGLVYSIKQDSDNTVVEYTATTPGCPMRRYLQQKIEEALQTTEGVDAFEARLVWDPEWNVDMIKEGVDFFTVPPPMTNR